MLLPGICGRPAHMTPLGRLHCRAQSNCPAGGKSQSVRGAEEPCGVHRYSWRSAQCSAAAAVRAAFKESQHQSDEPRQAAPQLGLTSLLSLPGVILLGIVKRSPFKGKVWGTGISVQILCYYRDRSVMKRLPCTQRCVNGCTAIHTMQLHRSLHSSFRASLNSFLPQILLILTQEALAPARCKSCPCHSGLTGMACHLIWPDAC